MFKIYFIGIIILVAAILLNGVINRLGILGWFDFITLLVDKETDPARKVRIIDILWLFIAYPFLLGLAGVGGNYVHTSLFQK
jgi:hypothetical protein